MKKNNGFTVLEMVMVMAIMGIMLTIAFVKYNRTVAANELERAVNGLYMELRGLRALAFKYDDTVKVTFNPTADPPQIKTEVWASMDQPPAYKTVSTYKIEQPVKMGVPSGVTLSQPYNDAWWNAKAGEIVNGLQGDWKTALKVVPDSRGEYAHGGVYLYNPRLGNTVYFIGISMSMQSIELKKWKGSSWINL